MLLRLILLVLVLAGPAFAQDVEAPVEKTVVHVPDGLDSPQATIRTFVHALVADRTPDAVACMEVEGLDPAVTGFLADQLYASMIRIEEVDPRDYPSEHMLDPETDRWVFFPAEFDAAHQRILRDARPDGQIVLVKGADGGWRFSAETVAGIATLRDTLETLAPVEGTVEAATTLGGKIDAWVRDQTPAFASEKLLGVKIWQWIGLALLIFAGVVIDLVVRRVLSLVVRRVAARRGGEVKPETIRRAVRPFGLAVAALFWVLTLAALVPDAQVMPVLLFAARVFWMLAAVWAAWRATDLVGEIAESRAARSESKFDDLLVPLVRKGVKIFIFAFGVIYIAGSLHIDIKPLLAGLGIGGVGFAFAAKDTIENFFGSITVLVDRPFQVGDWVTIGDAEGTVEELGLRSVRIRTFYNSLVTIPTANLVRAAVDNYGRRKYRRWTTHLNLTYDTPPEKIEAFCEGLRELIRLHPYTRKDYYQVWLHQFGPHSLDVLVYLFFEAPDWQTELRERHRFMIDAIRLAQRLGVEFAFPTQTLHVVQDQEGAAEEAPGGRHPDTESRREGRRLVREVTADEAWRQRKPGPHSFRHSTDPDDDDDETQIESKVGGDA